MKASSERRTLRRVATGGLVLLIGLTAILGPFLFRIWKANGERGGQQPAEPFRIAGNFYYVH